MRKHIMLVITLTVIVMLTLATVSNAANLMPGERKNGNTIEGVLFRAPADEISVRDKQWGPEPGASPNYAISVEKFQYFYEGYIQFQPSYETKPSDCCGLVAYRHVKQAFIDYERGGVSVASNGSYTVLATSKSDTKIYKTSVKAHDSLIPGESHRTYFIRKWFYFD